ncbi:MAG: tRNA (guanosine(46)-N7)-methyltransferase TrmB [Termitinemataceae bacterium]|nr:MAG: tRNA (guanosine(46)-N7)-methyltransferase TrmB [Termitinemataceae bacterium]
MEYKSVKSFCLRGGRMTVAQERSYINLHDSICIPLSEIPLNYKTIFNNTNPVVIEIGFGQGQATAIIAKDNPEINYIGIEVFKAGIGKLLWRIENMQINNIRIIEGDAVEILQKMIPDCSISTFHIFFADPWPKKKHHKRRLVKRPFTDLLASKLEYQHVTGTDKSRNSLPYIHFVTDWKEYADFAFAELSATPQLIASNTDILHARPKTKFEERAVKAGRPITELVFTKST